MLVNIGAGALLVFVTALVHGVGLLVLSGALRASHGRYRLHTTRIGTMAAVLATVLGLFAIHSVEIWVWALAYVAVGALPDLESALLFSTLSFSTLGAEEVSATPEWQLLGSIEGVNGFLLIGWSTAYLIPAWTRYGLFHQDPNP